MYVSARCGRGLHGAWRQAQEEHSNCSDPDPPCRCWPQLGPWPPSSSALMKQANDDALSIAEKQAGENCRHDDGVARAWS
eukprot:1139722-Pelagomonas_calceolata.AAC.3